MPNSHFLLYAINMLQSNFLQECTQFCEKAENPASIEPARFSLCFHGPSDRSRTCGLLNPIQARYQSALHPDLCVCTFTALCYINTSKFQMQDVFAGKTKKSLKIPNNKASQNKVPDICAGTKEVRCIFVHAAHFNFMLALRPKSPAHGCQPRWCCYKPLVTPQRCRPN